MLGYFLWSLAAFIYLGVGARVYLDLSEDFPDAAILGHPIAVTLIVLLWPALMVILVPLLVLVIFGSFIAEAIETLQEKRQK